MQLLHNTENNCRVCETKFHARSKIPSSCVNFSNSHILRSLFLYIGEYMKGVDALSPCDIIKLWWKDGDRYIRLPKEYFGTYEVKYYGDSFKLSEFGSSNGAYFYKDKYDPKTSYIYGNYKLGQRIKIEPAGIYGDINLIDDISGESIGQGHLLINKNKNREIMLWYYREMVFEKGLYPHNSFYTKKSLEYDFFPCELISTPKRCIKISNFYLEKVF